MTILLRNDALLSLDRRVVLQLGSGKKYDPAAVNVDIVSSTKPDIVQDLDVRPWPLPEDHFSEVRAGPGTGVVSPARLLRLGSVAWAKIEDANGFGKVRPVAVVTPTAEIAIGKPPRVIAITTRLPGPLPSDHGKLRQAPTMSCEWPGPRPRVKVLRCIRF